MAALHFLQRWNFPITQANLAGKDVVEDAMVAAAGHVHVLQFLVQWAHQGQVMMTLHHTPALAIALHAAWHGNVDVLQYLKSLGIQWKNLDTETWGPIMRNRWMFNKVLPAAIKGGHLDILHFCKQWAPDIMQTVRRDTTVFHAIFYGRLAVIRLLRDWGLRVQDLRADHYEPLLEATRRNRVDMWTMFRAWRDWPNADDKVDRLTTQDLRHNDNEILRWAVKRGHMDMLRILRDWRDPDGAGLTPRDIRGRRNEILFCGALYGHVNVCRFLKEWSEENFEGRLGSEAPSPSSDALCTRLGALDVRECMQGRSEQDCEQVMRVLGQVFGG
jgi:hypothetical protein